MQRWRGPPLTSHGCTIFMIKVIFYNMKEGLQNVYRKTHSPLCVYASWMKCGLCRTLFTLVIDLDAQALIHMHPAFYVDVMLPTSLPMSFVHLGSPGR